MAWLERHSAPLASAKTKTDTPEGLWERCKECSEVFFRKEFVENMNVCPKCQHHFPIDAISRINHFLDEGSFEELDSDLCSADPLKFNDGHAYSDRLQNTRNKLNRNDAIVCGRGMLKGRPVELGVFDFSFMGGSMGAVVGEKIARLFARAESSKNPAIVVTSSGGARMQEGILSLMQMAKTCAALAKLRDAGVPFLSILTHPTTGGVAASFATLGDINIGEPGALIGFAGPRVIQQTIGEELPPGFQRSEYLLEHGMLDMICHRDGLRDLVIQLLNILAPAPKS